MLFLVKLKKKTNYFEQNMEKSLKPRNQGSNTKGGGLFDTSIVVNVMVMI